MISLRRHFSGAALLWFLLSLRCAAGTWSAPAAELARNIVDVTGTGTASLTLKNFSTIAADQVIEIRRELEAQLRAAGIRTVTKSANQIQVTLSENLQSLLWIAEVGQESAPHVVMVSVPRPQAAVAPARTPTVSIRKSLLWTQDKQILDAVVLDAATPNPRLLVLDPDNLTAYRANTGKWELERAMPVTHARTFPRDLRGRIVVGKELPFEVYLPGVVCSASDNTMTCRESDDPWPIGTRAAFFSSARNFFAGALVPATDKQIVPFYSAAVLEKSGSEFLVLSGVDGRIRTFDGVNERVLGGATGWGSDIATVKSGCGSGSQVLVSGTGDDTAADSLRAFEFPERDPVAVSAGADFNGPILALWPSPDGSSATAVARNLKTGAYEAYTVSVNCNQ